MNLRERLLALKYFQACLDNGCTEDEAWYCVEAEFSLKLSEVEALQTFRKGRSGNYD